MENEIQSSHRNAVHNFLQLSFSFSQLNNKIVVKFPYFQMTRRPIQLFLAIDKQINKTSMVHPRKRHEKFFNSTRKLYRSSSTLYLLQITMVFTCFHFSSSGSLNQHRQLDKWTPATIIIILRKLNTRRSLHQSKEIPTDNV